MGIEYSLRSSASWMFDGSGMLFVSGRLKPSKATTMQLPANMINGKVGSTFLPF